MYFEPCTLTSEILIHPAEAFQEMNGTVTILLFQQKTVVSLACMSRSQIRWAGLDLPMHSPVYIAPPEDLYVNTVFMAFTAKIPTEVLMQLAWLICLYWCFDLFIQRDMLQENVHALRNVSLERLIKLPWELVLLESWSALIWKASLACSRTEEITAKPQGPEAAELAFTHFSSKVQNNFWAHYLLQPNLTDGRDVTNSSVFKGFKKTQEDSGRKGRASSQFPRWKNNCHRLTSY